MKITKQGLRRLIKEELNKLRETDNPFASDGTGLPSRRREGELRRGAANTRGTGPYSSQPEPEPEAEEDLSIEDLAEDIRDMIEGKINDIIDDAELHNYLMEVIELLREDTHTLGQE